MIGNCMRHNILAVVIVALVASGCSSRSDKPAVANENGSSEDKADQFDLPGDVKSTEIKPTEVKPNAVQSWPTGHSTPEGVACDLARSFINRDAELFLDTCIPKFGGGVNADKYEDFLASTSSSIRAESKKETPSQAGPAKIVKLFVARHLSQNGPASYGYAVHNFHEVMFVDVDVELLNGETFSNRTLVLKTSKGLWYVHPHPSAHPLLSGGLNNESTSTDEFAGKAGAPSEDTG